MEQQTIVERLLAAGSPEAREQQIAALHSHLGLATIDALKQRVDATKLRNAGQALTIAEVALAVAAQLADPLAEGLALWASGNALYHLSRYQDALRCYGRAEAIYAAAGRALEVTRLRINQVAVLQDTAAFTEALALAEVARRACGQLGSAARPFLALLEMNSGAAYQQLGRLAEALEAYARGRAILVDLDNQVEIARIDINRANVLQEMGRFAEAAALYAAAAATLAATGNEQELARAEHNLGKLAYRRGRYHEALRHLEAARAIYAAIPNPLEVAKADLYRALVYRDLNLLSETIDLATAAERSFARAVARWERAMALIVAGMGHARLGHFGLAEQQLARARRLLRQQGALDRLLALDVDRAELLLAQGRVAAARRLATRVARQVDPAAWPALAVRAQATLAYCDLRASPPNPLVALRRVAAAQIIAERHRLPERAALAHVAGQAHELAGDRAAAQQSYTAALTLVEAQRRALPFDEIQLAFLDNRLPIYRDAARLSLEQLGPAVGLAALSLLLSAPIPRPPPAPASSQLAAALHELRERWHWQQSRLEDLSEAGAGRNEAERQAVEQRLRAVESEIADLSLRHEVWSIDALLESQGDTNPLSEMSVMALERDLCAKLAPGEGLLVGAPLGDRIALVLLTSEGLSMQLRPAPTLERTLRAWRFYVQHGLAAEAGPAALATARAYLARFHAALIAPIASQLAGLQRLTLALDPAWHDLPLAAAFDGEHYLVERLTLSYLSTPAALLSRGGLPMQAGAYPALVIGCSDGGRLPAALDEAAKVADLLAPATCLLEEQATPARVQAALPSCGLLHLASHALFRPDNPRFSWVRLAGGRLSVADLAEIRLAGRPLVVLSACETGRGLPRGGGLLGMGRALMSAGASALVVSLWQIADASTTPLMCDFHRARAAHDSPTALALAQREACGRGEHPFHWAGFVCIEG